MEVFLPQEMLLAVSDDEEHGQIDKNMKPVAPSRSSIMAYPSAWADNFGCNYYRHSQAKEMAVIRSTGGWKISEEAKPFSGTGLNVTPPDKLFQGIHTIINEMKQEAKADDNGAGET